MRDPKGKCVDAQNCDFERWTVCAFDTQPIHTRVQFLDCLDTPWTDELTTKKVKQCAGNTTGIDVSMMETCFSGERGDQLLEQASKAFVAAFPKPVYMPQTTVAGKVVDATYDSVKKAACAAGSTSSVC